MARSGPSYLKTSFEQQGYTDWDEDGSHYSDGTGQNWWYIAEAVYAGKFEHEGDEATNKCQPQGISDPYDPRSPCDFRDLDFQWMTKRCEGQYWLGDKPSGLSSESEASDWCDVDSSAWVILDAMYHWGGFDDISPGDNIKINDNSIFSKDCREFFIRAAGKPFSGRPGWTYTADINDTSADGTINSYEGMYDFREGNALINLLTYRLTKSWTGGARKWLINWHALVNTMIANGLDTDEADVVLIDQDRFGKEQFMKDVEEIADAWIKKGM